MGLELEVRDQCECLSSMQKNLPKTKTTKHKVVELGEAWQKGMYS